MGGKVILGNDVNKCGCGFTSATIFNQSACCTN